VPDDPLIAQGKKADGTPCKSPRQLIRRTPQACNQWMRLSDLHHDYVVTTPTSQQASHSDWTHDDAVFCKIYERQRTACCLRNGIQHGIRPAQYPGHSQYACQLLAHSAHTTSL
jgi:hypothetical protein